MPLKPIIAAVCLPLETIHRTTRDLTTSERLLLQIMTKHQFGRLENVPVEAGQPVLHQSTKIVRVARLGVESGGTTVPGTDAFELKQEVRALFDELARLQNGTVVKLEFRHGLPFLLETIAKAVAGDGNDIRAPFGT
jgi:hypothetical protein